MSQETNRAIDAVLCDMDDTVLVHRPYADELWLEVVETFPSKLSHDERLRLSGAIVGQRHEFWSNPEVASWGRLEMTAARKYFVTKALQDVSIKFTDFDVDELVAEFSRRREESVTLPDANQRALLELKARGVLLALVTNGQGDAQRDKVNRFGLDSIFDTIIIEGEIGFGKPDWEVYRRALINLDVIAERAVMVGDNWEWEVVAPCRYALKALWVQTLDQSLPTPIPEGFIGQIESFSEVPSVLKGTFLPA